MNKSRHSRTQSDPRAPDLFAEGPAGETASTDEMHADPEIGSTDSTPVDPTPNEGSFGGHLRAAREARGVDVSACAHELYLSTRVLRKMEADDYSGIDSRVYLRSYLSKYGTYLGLSRDDIDAHLKTLQDEQPTLVSTGGIPRSRYLLERYATAATYLVLTAVIVVPIVWIGLKGGLDHEVAHLAPLDSAPVAASKDASATSNVASSDSVQRKVVADHSAFSSDQPLQASLAPFSALDSFSTMMPSSKQPMTTGNGAQAVDSGSHSLTLTLPAKSWVEITDADGQRLEYGLLPAGTRKTYHSAGALKVSIGNASGATVSVDGKLIDLQAYQHANVARFELHMDNGKTVPQAM